MVVGPALGEALGHCAGVRGVPQMRRLLLNFVEVDVASLDLAHARRCLSSELYGVTPVKVLYGERRLGLGQQQKEDR